MSEPLPAPQNVTLLVLPGAADLDVSMTLEIIRITNSLSNRSAVDVSIMTIDDNPVTLTNGRTLAPTGAADTFKHIDLCLVLSHVNPKPELWTRIQTVIRKLARQSTAMAATDHGPLLLAAAGLLQGKVATCHIDLMVAARETYPEVRWVDRLFVREGAVLTCAGHLAVVDMLLTEIAALMGEDFRSTLAAELVAPPLRVGGASQRDASVRLRASDDLRIQEAIRLMRAHIETPLSVESIAKRVGISQRALELSWRRSLGCSPKRYYMQERINHACSLLLFSNLAINEISYACGFSSSATFSRAFSSFANVTPRDYRLAHGNKIAPVLPVSESHRSEKRRGASQ